MQLPMRDRIVEVASELFVARGFDGVSIRDIAAACGITNAALYYHFSAKTDLLRAILADYLEETARLVDVARESSADAAGRLRAVVEGLIAQPPARRALMRLAMHDIARLPAEVQQELRGTYERRFVGGIRTLFAAGMESGEFVVRDPEVLTWVLLGMLYPFFSSGARLVTPETTETILGVLFDGLRVRD